MSEFAHSARARYEAHRAISGAKKDIGDLAFAARWDIRHYQVGQVLRPNKKDRLVPGLDLGHALIPRDRHPLKVMGRENKIITRLGIVDQDRLFFPDQGVFAAYHDAPTEVDRRQQTLTSHGYPQAPAETVVYATIDGKVGIKTPVNEEKRILTPTRLRGEEKKKLTLEQQISQQAGKALDAITVVEFIGDGFEEGLWEEGMPHNVYTYANEFERLQEARENLQRFDPPQERHPLVKPLMRRGA